MRKYLWVILASGAVLAISMGIRQSFGLYLTPISKELGLGRETFALSMGLLNLIWGLAAPIAGAMTDKFGPRLVILFGAITYAIGLTTMSVATDNTTVLTAGIIMGLGISGTGFTAVLGAVGRAVPTNQRSFALGLVSMGGSIGQFAALPTANTLLNGFGWSTSLLILAAFAASMAILGFTIANAPKSVENGPGDQESWSETLNAALNHKSFILLTTGFCVCGFHIAFIAVHLPAFLQDKGFDTGTGATALMIIGLGNIAGTYFFGWIGQHVEQRIALSALYLARAAIFIPFLTLPLDSLTVWTLSALTGFLWLGTIPLTSGLVATMFGPRWMSMLFGIVFLSHQIGSFLGAWLGGRLYDAFGNYESMWWISIILGLLAALLHWPIDESPVVKSYTSQQQA